uniref:hypothetical protein n=1 Tax=Paractinoplanes polyasparticus TaxID=2856853 RepID=UPI001C845F78|nr:hypothetical protein [Actinoplanes polyasparticus]
MIAESLEVGVFTRAESVRLLQRRNPTLPQPDADRLAGALGDLPLAIEHASAWLHATDMAVNDYLDLIREKQARLADLDLAPGCEIPVAAAANVALDRLAVETRRPCNSCRSAHSSRRSRSVATCSKASGPPRGRRNWTRPSGIRAG